MALQKHKAPRNRTSHRHVQSATKALRCGFARCMWERFSWHDWVDHLLFRLEKTLSLFKCFERYYVVDNKPVIADFGVCVEHPPQKPVFALWVESSCFLQYSFHFAPPHSGPHDRFSPRPFLNVPSGSSSKKILRFLPSGSIHCGSRATHSLVH